MNGKTETTIGTATRIGVRDDVREAVIDIVGVIGRPEQLPDDGTVQGMTYARFMEALDRIRAVAAPEVVVNIRSTGGDVQDALLIYEALRSLDARVVTRCYGYTALAATLIAQAASEGCREISAHALYLIHCSESAAEGNARSLTAVKELLDRTDERLAALYAERSGRPAERLAALMNENDGRGRWLTPREAVACGLADRIIAGEVTGHVPAGEEVLAMCRLLGMTPPPDGFSARGRCWRRWRESWERWRTAGVRKEGGAGTERAVPSVEAAVRRVSDAQEEATRLRRAQQAACRTEVAAGRILRRKSGRCCRPTRPPICKTR